MVALAISILWFAIGVIVLLACVWLAMYAIEIFSPIPERIKQLVWVIILILIGALTLLSGGGGSNPFHLQR